MFEIVVQFLDKEYLTVVTELEAHYIVGPRSIGAATYRFSEPVTDASHFPGGTAIL